MPVLETSVRNINGSTIALNIQFLPFYRMQYNFNVTSKKYFENRENCLKLIKNYAIR